MLSWLLNNLDGCENPRALGKPLKGVKAGVWRYRIGNYRVLCEIRDEELLVLALEVGIEDRFTFVEIIRFARDD